MTSSPPNPVAAAASEETFMAANKAKEYLHIFAEGSLSFFALLLSIFIYVSVFNLSLSTDLFNNTKFWFCISNTLILIIAADYRAFSPSKQKPESYFRHEQEEDCLRNTANSQLLENPNKKLPSIPKQEKEAVSVLLKRENPEDHKLQMIEEFEKRTKFPAKTDRYRRSKSEKAKRAESAAVDEERKMISMRRSRTVKHRTTEEESESEKNVLEEMTDEELNRRVEEFIQRFNRQIRLQDVGNGDGV